jgi:hypothetical protein
LIKCGAAILAAAAEALEAALPPWPCKPVPALYPSFMERFYPFKGGDRTSARVIKQ